MAEEDDRRGRAVVPSFQVAPQSIASELAGHLERLILSGEIEAGSLLPPERTLAADFKISRATVRGALAQLESKRLIERRQGRGSTVLGPSEDTVELAAMLASSSLELQNAIELRQVVEPQIARFAAIRALPSDFASLRQVTAQANEHLTPAESMKLDVQFHLLLAQATQNPLLLTVSRFSFACTEKVRIMSHRTRAGRRTSLEGHQAIFRAVLDREPDAAQVAMEAHLREVQEISVSPS